MAEMTLRDFPLFPLGIVALPGERLPLHIFEDRYKSMVARCLEFDPGESGRRFGIIWLADDGLRSIGCTCEVEQVLERMEDGRLNILARGMDPLRLVERDDRLPFPSGTIELLDDEGERDDDAAEQARKLYGDLILKATERELGTDELTGMDAYEIAGTIEFPVAQKQQLLELRSEGARMRLLCSMLTEAIKRLSLADIAEVRARSNGHVWYG